MTEQARVWRPDALLIRIEIEVSDEPRAALDSGPLFYFLSPSERSVTRLPGGSVFPAGELLADQFGVRGRFVPIPDFVVDLPEALRIAATAGMRSEMRKAELSVRTPAGRLPILAWRIESGEGRDPTPYYVDALTGVHLGRREMLGPLAEPDATLQESQNALREALLQSAPGAAGNATPWMEFVVKPILESRDVFECTARGGGWSIIRMCLP